MESKRKLIGEGAEAKIYSLKVFKEKLIEKVRIEKKYRIKEIDEEMRQSRTRREAKIIYSLGKLGVNAPRLVALGRFSIYTNMLDGKLIKDIKTPVDFSKIGMQLALMHNGDIAHGDFTPANVMKCDNEYFVIDFGLSEITNSTEEKAIDLLLMKRSIEPEKYLRFAKGYAKNSKNAKPILKRLSEIEKRGRYQIRTMS